MPEGPASAAGRTAGKGIRGWRDGSVERGDDRLELRPDELACPLVDRKLGSERQERVGVDEPRLQRLPRISPVPVAAGRALREDQIVDLQTPLRSSPRR